MYTFAVLLLSVAFSWAYTPCTQRSFRDFRTDPSDCRTFYICSLGQLVSMRCPAGSVIDVHTRSCVPAHSFLDTCSGRQTTHHAPCPRGGSKSRVPHPTRCAQYYECGGMDGQRAATPGGRGWDRGQRECPYPFVFSAKDSKCVPLGPGVCGTREEPLDHCDYQANNCEGHADCVPCHIRFPSCRGQKDGLNAWAGRQGSPYYVTCHQQRVLSTGMCKQDGAVSVFDAETQQCVKKDEEEGRVPQSGSAAQHVLTPPLPQHAFIPPLNTHLHHPALLSNLPATSQSRPRVPQPVNTPNRDQFSPNQNQYQSWYQQQQQQQQQQIVHVPFLRI
ncbi:uncharacterized protein LOC143285210 [Babylonia areolata]|uniref:uncharacterized protein LOC143285210 n=1 Tax=Babylonia areolata TaxID=304850 RepID=UPI003FD195DD